MKILVVSNFYPPRAEGGAEIVAHRFSVEMVRRGHVVEVFAGRVPKSDETGGELELEVVDGINVHLLSLRTLDPAKSFFWEASGRRFRSVLLHFKPDVVHFHNLMGLGVNLILEAQRLGVRTVCTVHDHWGFCLKNTLCLDDGSLCVDWEACHNCLNFVVAEDGTHLPTRLRRDYVKYCLMQVDQLVFPTQYLANSYQAAGFCGENMVVQSNGIEIERFYQKEMEDRAGGIRFSFIGYLGEHKGLRLLIDSVDTLIDDRDLSGKEWSLNIVGDGHLRGYIEEIAQQSRFRGHLCFLEKLNSDEIPDLLSSTDVVVLPSIWPENEPVVLLEAMAAGVAQLASRVGGHVELVEDERSGFLFDRASVEDLVRRMKDYILSPGLSKHQGIYNRKRSDRYCQASAVDAYEALYMKAKDAGRSVSKIILCGGSWPTLEATGIFNSFSCFDISHNIFFIYMPWASRSIWLNSTAMFVWSSEANEAVILNASRLMIPVIGPADNPTVKFLEKECGLGIMCHNSGEIIAAITDVQQNFMEDRDTLEPIRMNDYISAGVSGSAFYCISEKPN